MTDADREALRSAGWRPSHTGVALRQADARALLRLLRRLPSRVWTFDRFGAIDDADGLQAEAVHLQRVVAGWETIGVRDAPEPVVEEVQSTARSLVAMITRAAKRPADRSHRAQLPVRLRDMTSAQRRAARERGRARPREDFL